jgi:histidine phosphotransfer protein HptB
MNHNRLMRLLSDYGADTGAINDRFLGNTELYELCFKSFIEEEHHGMLREAMEKGDLENAFFSAHAMKGLSGNLGLTAYYDAVFKLTEALRAKRGEEAAQEYKSVCAELERVREIAKAAEI